MQFRLDADLRAALIRQANREARDVSQLIRNVLRRAMIEAGQLEEAPQR